MKSEGRGRQERALVRILKLAERVRELRKAVPDSGTLESEQDSERKQESSAETELRSESSPAEELRQALNQLNGPWNSVGDVALAVAIRCGGLDAVSKLLDCGVDPNRVRGARSVLFHLRALLLLLFRSWPVTISCRSFSLANSV